MDLIDISTVVFRTIIDYMYKNELPVNHPDLIGLYMAARHLELKDLQDFSETQIHSRTNASNAYEILVFSNKIDSKKLKDKAFDVIKEMFPGQSLKEEIKHQPEKIKKVIDANRQIDKLMTEMRKDIESLTVVDSQ
ncbi:CLUMA_CG012924, isoform A [Clunio marinus]|uniref:CLUMA_CG012924, isoform A n=1 Tax=Clunio marinus TaxID=568069 RepID=A0A1J1IJ91_9DIPT|nr:CLUMA_CG012924, isoform A [Clunio marinus]